MHGMDVFMLKNCTTSAPDSRKQPYVYEWCLIFFHKLLFGDIKLSDLERRNRKLSAHDCTDHIKTLFSSDNYHKTIHKTTTRHSRHVARTRPHFFCATLLVMAAWKRSTCLDRSCCGGIITGRFVSLLIKKYQQDEREDTCWQIASRFQFLISFSERLSPQ